jgi:hypothetical protein
VSPTANASKPSATSRGTDGRAEPNATKGPHGPFVVRGRLALLGRRPLPGCCLFAGRCLPRRCLLACGRLPRRSLLARGRLPRRCLLPCGRLPRRCLLARGCLPCGGLLACGRLLSCRPLLRRLSGARSCLLGWTHDAAFRQRRALRVALAYEGPALSANAFGAGAAGWQSLRSCSGTPRTRSSLRPLCGPRFCAGCTTSSIASTATLSSNSNVFNGATDSQVMKKYLTIRQEPSLAVKHFRCNACSRKTRTYARWTRKPFVCKDFLHVAS